MYKIISVSSNYNIIVDSLADVKDFLINQIFYLLEEGEYIKCKIDIKQITSINECNEYELLTQYFIEEV